MHIGEFLYRFRKAKKLSRKKMADLLDVSEFRLQKWEDKFFSPKIGDDAKIRNFFNITSIVNLSEEILERCMLAEVGNSVTVDVETVMHQKDLLIEEKDKRLKEKDKYIGAQ